MSSVFIITSMLKPTTTPLSYTPTRSVYTYEQRLEQTLKSVQSIRERVPSARIVLVEGSADADTSSLGVETYRVRDNRAAHNSPAKGAAEVYSIFEYLHDSPPSEEHIFKLSGRYWLDERFDLEEYMIPCDVCHRGENGYASTVLYKIYRDNLAVYLQSCQRTIHDPAISAGALGIEYKQLNYGNFYNIPVLGVCGNVSVDGTFYRA